MKTIKQLLRQPIKTVVGIIIVALAFAILVTCVGQYTATDLTRENLDDQYTTIGLLSSSYLQENISHGVNYLSELPEEKQAWVDWTIQSRPDIIREVSSTGLVSAYIPKLNIDNFTQHKSSSYNISMYNKGYPYRCAMMTVSLTRISEVVGGTTSQRIGEFGSQDVQLNAIYLCLGTVESVIGLEQGFASPVGKTILLYVKVFEQEDFDVLDLQVGKTYLVYGEDYCDQPREGLRSLINANGDKRSAQEAFFGEQQWKNGIPNYDPWMEQFDCSLTICDPASLLSYVPVYNEFGAITGFEVSEDLREILWLKDDNTVSVRWIPEEEYAPYYQLPTIAPLNGSADDFLASEEGALWQETLDKMEINNHGFPVLCVDKLGYQAMFAREQTRIVEGRDFSESELVNGEKVCIISESVAVKSGVSVGDTIELRTYVYDTAFQFQFDEREMGSSYPFAALYSEAQGFSSEMEAYTIVGLYRQEDSWQNAYDQYGFTPNTIFVPKSSVTADMITKDKGIYSTLVLHNGKMEEFKTLMEEAGYPDLFICYDQGYSEFVASLDAYEEVSQKALYIGLAAFVAIILLFLLIYPAQQKRSLLLMGTLGASACGRFRHTFVSILCVLVTGAALGGYVGSKLWTRIAAALMEWINIEIALESDMTAIAPKLTAASLAVVALAALLVSAALCRNRGLMKRK